MKTANTHYVYKITNNNPTNERKYYIGVRTAKDCTPEDDTEYWSSSKYLKEAIVELGLDCFSKEILSTWETREEALEEEVRLHNLYNVSSNNEYYNKAKQTSVGFSTNKEIHEKSVNVRKNNDSYKIGGIKASKTAKNRTDEERALISEKFKETFSKIDTYERAMKTKETKNKTILESGKTLMESTIEKSAETMRNNGWYETLSKKQKENQLEIQESGLSKGQESRRKQYKTQLNNVDVNGLNGAQRAALKYHENLKNTIDEETGLSKADLRIKRQKETIKSKGSHSGKNNSAFGFRWIYNIELKESKRVLESELEFYYSNGWLKGMKREYCKNKK